MVKKNKWSNTDKRLYIKKNLTKIKADIIKREWNIKDIDII